MQFRVIAGLTALLLVVVPAPLAQPAPGEPIPPPGPVAPGKAPLPEGTPVLRPGAEPHYGERTLLGGFRPDPVQFAVTAGGPLDASTIGGECVGWIPEAPTLDVFYQPGDTRFPLIFSAIADRGEDITLVVRDPIGTLHCNDDANGTSPMVRIENSYFGIWGVWLGTYEVRPDTPATLYVSEVGAAWDDVDIPANEPDLDLVEQELRLADMFGELPNQRVTLRSGFLPDPYTVTVPAGGTRPAIGNCPGYNDGPPDFLLSYVAGEYPLLITTYSNTDTTLLVMDPNLRTHCDDDSFGHDPMVRFASPQTGVYAIWVGTYSPTPGRIQVRLDISERSTLR